MTWIGDAWDYLFGSSGSSSNSGDVIGTNRDGSPIYQGPVYSSGSGSSSGSGGSWIGDAYDWYKRNRDDIKGVVGAGRELYNMYSANSARQGSRNDFLNFLRQSEGQDNEYQRQMWEYRNRQAAANAAAARANDAARRKASNKAFKKQKKMLEQLIAQYQPYTDAAKALTPKMQENYSQFLDTTALLNQYLTPKVMESLTTAPKPTSEINVPKARYDVPMPQGVPVSFLRDK